MHIIVTHAEASTARIITALLTDAGHAVTFAKSAVAAFRCGIVDGADAILLDTVLPDLDAVWLCHELRTHGFTGIIIFVSRDQALSTRVKALRAGADDYIVNPFDDEELKARLEAIERRVQLHAARTQDAIVRAGSATLSLGELTFRIAGHEPVRLTPTEMRLLELLMRSAGTPVSRDALMEQIWGVDVAGDTNPVDVYVRRLRRKIEPHPEQPAFLRTVRGYGYVFSTSSPSIVLESTATSDDGLPSDGNGWYIADAGSCHSVLEG